MTIHGIYIIRNKVIEVNSPLFICNTRASAERTFRDMLKDMQDDWSEFDLYHIGNFSQSSFAISDSFQPKHIINGYHFKDKENQET